MNIFKGAVLYNPTGGAIARLHDIIDHVDSNKPNIKEIINQHRTGWLKNTVNWNIINKEISKYLGWTYIKHGIDYTATGEMVWVTSVREVLIMLEFNDSCYITPLQAASVKTALEHHKRLEL